MSASATSFVAIVPARRASTRLPDKALADLAGKPMVVRVADRARASGASRVVVATDDASIADAVVAHGHDVAMTDAGHVSGTDRIAEVTAALVRDGAIDRDTIVVNVQGDEPLVDPRLIAQVAATLAASPDCAMATACHPIATDAELRDPNVVKVVARRARPRALLLARADPVAARCVPGGATVAMRHVGLYAYRAGFLATFTALAPAPIEAIEALEQLRALWHGHAIAVCIADDAPLPGVDTPDDLARVRAWFASGANRD